MRIQSPSWVSGQLVEPGRVADQQLVLLPVQDARQRDASAGRDAAGQGFGQRVQGRGEDIGDDDRIGGQRFVLRQVDRQPVADAIAFGVVEAGDQRLRIVVHADGAGGAQLERGQGEDARAAAEIEHGRTLQLSFAGQRVQPPQAQRGGGMRAGAEGQARIAAARPPHRRASASSGSA